MSNFHVNDKPFEEQGYFSQWEDYRNQGKIQDQSTAKRQETIKQLKNYKAKIALVALGVIVLIALVAVTIVTHGTALPLIGHYIMPLMHPAGHGFLFAVKNFVDQHIGLTMALAWGLGLLVFMNWTKNRVERDEGISPNETESPFKELYNVLRDPFQLNTDQQQSILLKEKQGSEECYEMEEK